MIFKRLTSIALIAALCLPNTLMAVKKDHYLAEADSEGRPLMDMKSTTSPVVESPCETSTSDPNTFVTVPLNFPSATTSKKTPTEVESQVAPSRKPFQCTSERLNCVTSWFALTLGGLMLIGALANIIWILTAPPSDPCSNQTTTLDPTASDFTLAPATLGSSGRGRTVASLHHYQKRRGGSTGRGGVSRICPSPTTRSTGGFTSTLLSNFYDLTSSSITATDTASTTSDTAPPPLTQE